MQEHARADASLLQSSFSAELPPEVQFPRATRPPPFGHRHSLFTQNCATSNQPFNFAPLEDESDENRPPLSPGTLNASLRIPSPLTEHVRQQAKARTTRVKVVRKAAVHNGNVQAASLDFDQLQRPSGQNVLQPRSVNGITAAFQLSWPPPGAMATAIGLTGGAECLRSSGKTSGAWHFGCSTWPVSCAHSMCDA